MDEKETTEAILSVVGLSLFFCMVTLGTMLASTNPDSFMYVNFNPPEDFILLAGLILIHCFFLFYFLSQSLNFRKSKNLNYRAGEILYISDKMKFYSLFNVPVQGYFIYFFIKYNQTPISLYLLLIAISGIGLILLFIYNSIRIKRDIKDEMAEK
jgi:hypothetical protein